MDLEADTMAQAVGEFLCIASLGNDRSRRGVYVPGEHPGPRDPDGHLLALPDDIVDPTHLLGGFSLHHRTGEIGTVAIDRGTEIHEDPIAASEFFAPRLAVWERGPGAEKDDRLERGAIRSEIAEDIEQPALRFPFGDTSGEFGQESSKGAVGDSGRFPDGLHLMGVLHDPQRLHQAFAWSKANSPLELPVESLVEKDAHRLGFESEPPGICFLYRPGNAGAEGSLPDNDDTAACHLCTCLLGIPPIGDENYFLGCEEESAVAAAESAQVANIGQGCDQKVAKTFAFQKNPEARPAFPIRRLTHAYTLVETVDAANHAAGIELL